MSLTTAVVTLWAAWALLRFWVRDRLLPPPGLPLTRVALRTLVEQGVVLSGACAVALTAMLVLAWMATAAGAADLALVRGAMRGVASIADAVSSAADALGTLLLALLTLAAAILWHLQ